MTNEQLTMKNDVSLPPSVCPPVSQDEKERAVFRSRRMFQTDMASDMATAEDRGEKKGRLAIARNMMKRNRPIEDIIEDTGLTREEVENLSVNTHH
jgi:predicted transposase/invertase (TIGR01784 family)